MRLFIDTNIILEYIDHRDQYVDVRAILSSINNKEHVGLVSQGSIFTLAYLVERSLKARGIHRPEQTRQLRQIMASILRLVEPVGISRPDMLSAVLDHSFVDLEDSLQYQYAAQNRCSVLITINENDYKNVDQRKLEILTPSAFVENYMEVKL